ncbi:hypothetical protein PFISCL1PPCAC_15783, partial [Pristionchus fissidentatus]
ELDQVETSFDKALFLQRCSSCTIENAEKIVSELEDESIDALPVKLQCLSLVAERSSKKTHSRLHALTRKVLKATSLTRADRKAVVAVLDVAPLPVCNDDIKELIEALEEPQMHIVIPFLSRFPRIISMVEKGSLPFAWAEVVLVRALHHTNGWIRSWAIETTVEMDMKLMRDNYQILLVHILPALSASDLLWRLVDKEKLESFYERLTQIFVKIAEDEDIVEGFIRSLLSCLSSLTCPVSIVLLVRSLSTSIPSLPILDEEDHPVMRECMVRIATISQLSLRLTIFTKMLKTMARLYDTPSISASIDSSLLFFGGIVRLLSSSHRFTVMQQTIESFSQSFLDALTVRQSEVSSNQTENFGVEEWWLLSRGRSSTIDGGCSLSQLRPFSRVVAAASCLDSKDPTVVGSLIHLTSKLGDFEVKDRFPLMDSLISAFKHVGMERGKVMKGVERMMEKTNEQFLLSLSFVGRFVSESNSDDQLTDRLFHKFPLFEELPVVSSGCELTRKEKCVLREEAEMARLRLVTDRVIERFDPTDIASQVLARVYEASLYEHKEQLIILMTRLVDRLPSDSIDCELVEKMLRSAEDVMNEEKKSAKYLPALTRLLALSTKLLQRGVLIDQITSLYTRLIDAASLNTSIAVVLARSIHDGIERMPKEVTESEEMCSILTELAVFGPIPKKETVVMHRCLRMIDEERRGEKNEEEEELRVHESTGRTRLYALLSSLRVVDQRGETAAIGLIEAVRGQIAEADKSSSKSFGLSLAHRKKTRAVTLLLILSSRGVPKSISTTVFLSCVDWLLDPCQQFSIKLVVEWLVARLAEIDDDIRGKLMGLDAKMAETRIGSVSSWINILTLMARRTEKPSVLSSLLNLLLPWCTAQNFAVRCTAIAACRIIMERMSEDEPVYSLAKAVANFGGEPNGNSQKIVGNLMVDFYFATIDTARDLDLETACCILTTRTGLPLDETIPVELMEEIVARSEGPPLLRVRGESVAVKEAPSLVYNSLEKNQRCAPSFETEGTETRDEIETENGKAAGDNAATSSESTQKKIIPKEGERRREGRSIYVVASFIDKAANLGGLCRTSEIFCVDRLVVADAAIVSDSTFKALSMSAESWQKIEEVRTDALPAWVAEMRTRGYSIVAAEQASDSVPLHKYQFPEKTVLIMGDEKRGVPMSILRSVDSIVHIEQLGRVRSLNVHVTAALFIHKYAEQHLIIDE